jgi:hypothetical protein
MPSFKKTRAFFLDEIKKLQTKNADILTDLCMSNLKSII